MVYTPDQLRNTLERFQQLKQNGKIVNPQKPPEWTDYQPQQLTYKPPMQQEEEYGALQGQVMRNDSEVTANALVEAQNRFNYNQMLQAQKQQKTAKQNFIAPIPAEQYMQQGQGVPTGAPGQYSPTDWGKDRIPEVSDIAKLNPNAPLRTMNFHGMNYTVNSQVAPIFQAFLKDLWKMGYKPKSIGGHADRNIAGTSTKSLHSYGFAIDIDPGLNPVTWNGKNVTALPPSVGALAAKYGLSWGGAWNGSKRDPMHFSVAYGGTK